VHFITKTKGVKRILRLGTAVLCITRFLQELNVVDITGVEILEKRVKFVLCLAQTESCICWICAEEAFFSGCLTQ